MFRLFTTLVMFGLIALGCFWLYNNVPQIQTAVQKAKHYLQEKDLLTLEIRYTPEQLMETHRAALVSGGDHTYLKPELAYYPYLLMEVKYSDPLDKRTREGVLLWSLDDGEMVLDASTWEKSHGFQDCLKAKAGPGDLRLIRALAEHGNVMRENDLSRSVKVEGSIFDDWLESATKKKLIIADDGQCRLHFEHPRFHFTPRTRLNQTLVTKPQRKGHRLPSRYSVRQIEALAEATFGGDFAVRSSKEVVLPVYNLSVQNPDGSIFSAHFNALNGKKLDLNHF